ncbi:unnamed protein product, partial [Discosporangium mesarthrocarpum]
LGEGEGDLTEIEGQGQGQVEALPLGDEEEHRLKQVQDGWERGTSAKDGMEALRDEKVMERDGEEEHGILMETPSKTGSPVTAKSWSDLGAQVSAPKPGARGGVDLEPEGFTSDSHHNTCADRDTELSSPQTPQPLSPDKSVRVEGPFSAPSSNSQSTTASTDPPST